MVLRICEMNTRICCFGHRGDKARNKANGRQAYTAEKMFVLRLFSSAFYGSCKIQLSNSFPFGISGQKPLQSDMKSRLGFS